jgi:hypothetical protein
MNIVSRTDRQKRPRMSAFPQADTKAGAPTLKLVGAVALSILASLWAVGLATPADAAIHPAMTITPVEARRKPREIAPPYIVEWVVPDWYRSRLGVRGRLLRCAQNRAS